MKTSEIVSCRALACLDVDRGRYAVPDNPVNPDMVSVVLVAEAAPADEALAAETTVLAFRDAGEDVETLDDIRALGVHLTTAIKCGKTRYAISTPTIRACAALLHDELDLFPFARSLLLMGDVAIKAANAVARRNGEPRVIPAGATYKLRGGDYRYRGMKAFASYLQAGPAFHIETTKRQFIAEDIAAALAHARGR